MKNARMCQREQRTENREQRISHKEKMFKGLNKKKMFFLFFCTLYSVLCTLYFAYAEELLIDDFEKQGNLVGGRSNTYEKEPSRALALRTDKEFFGKSGRSLMLKFDKKNEGGPYGTGGWCGYYTLLRSGDRYFDVSGYKAIAFQVKGSKGGENFKVGLADRHWEELGDSVKSKDITAYIASGKITTEWQKATIPLSEFFLDHEEIASTAICFETECFPTGAAKGTVYIDELRLE